MELKSLSQEELDQMSYGEITEIILTEKGSKMKIVDIFKKICKLLNMSDQEFESRIADFFELVSMDKKFIILDKGYCDLRKKHTPKVVIEDDEIDETEIELEESDLNPKEDEESETDIFYDNTSDEDDVDTESDELSDFIIMDDEDEVSM